ncbi:MAG TPA: RagB/SusD family nutrient uptake outer membrane protein [Puia sp.]|jgi:hypothetical protein|nr:RagB/SusD family nutrient uptake outer membrane protein [Puia sp.]
MKRIRKYWLGIAVLFAGWFIPTSCRKLTQTAPAADLLTVSKVFSGDESAQEAMSAFYIDMVFTPRSMMNAGTSLLAGLSGDELDCQIKPYPAEDSFRLNMLNANSVISNNLFTGAYALIYELNSILEGVAHSTGMSVAVQHELKGEAEFNRAMLYFYLVNLYGPVQLALKPNFQDNEQLARTSVDSVYAQLASDLEDAERLLPGDYIDAPGYTGDRTRPNQAAAAALLARIRLYQGKWASADSAATAVINNSHYVLETNLDSVFLSVSREAIWQLQPVHGPVATVDASVFLTPPGKPAFVFTSGLLGAFEAGDLRRQHWTKSSLFGGVTYTYPYKYKSLNAGATTEYEMVLRLAEQYLIRAEAEVQEGDVSHAIADLNVVRFRAGLPAYSMGTTTAAIMAAVMQERRIELMTEWGHRWLDLKRWGLANTVLSAEKPWWQTDDALYPIPAAQLQATPGMSQNAGY